MFAAIPRHDSIKDKAVVIMLGRVKHSLATEELDRSNRADEILRTHRVASIAPPSVFLSLPISHKTNLFHESVTRVRANDQLIIR
ncbi:MAG: hypothetical protein WBW93_14115, partial [Steroidobacteraceae bacterium]